MALPEQLYEEILHEPQALLTVQTYFSNNNQFQRPFLHIALDMQLPEAVLNDARPLQLRLDGSDGNVQMPHIVSVFTAVESKLYFLDVPLKSRKSER